MMRKIIFLVFTLSFFACSLTSALAEEIRDSNQGQNCGSLNKSECYLDSSYCSWDNNSNGCVKIGQSSTNNSNSSNTSSGSSSNSCVDTALGCVPYTIQGFSTWLMNILFGIAGGISFLLMIYGFILVATSSGDDKKLQGAKETITSAVTGLLVSIFALFIFRLIAVDILHIPGLN